MSGQWDGVVGLLLCHMVSLLHDVAWGCGLGWKRGGREVMRLDGIVLRGPIVNHYGLYFLFSYLEFKTAGHHNRITSMRT